MNDLAAGALLSGHARKINSLPVDRDDIQDRGAKSI